MKAYDLVRSAGPPHRLLMEVFANEMDAKGVIGAVKKQAELFYVDSAGKLIGTREKIATSLFHRSSTKGGITKIDDLVDCLHACDVAFSDIKFLDFRDCGLYTCDLRHIESVLDTILRGNSGTDFTLDLSLNFFSGKEFLSFIRDALSRGIYLDISLTPVLRPEFGGAIYDLAQHEGFHRLIFVPPHHLPDSSWQRMFPSDLKLSREFKMNVLKSHTNYYNRIVG